MELKTFFVQDAQGNILPTPTVYLYLPGTTTLASGLQDASGSPLSNPFLGDANGRVQLAAPSGAYDLRVVKGERDYTMRVQFVDLDEQLSEAREIAGNLRGMESKLLAIPSVSVVEHGATGSGTETAALQAACLAAVDAGHRRVFIPFPSFAAANDTDCLGCELFGADTELTGRMVNHAGLHNIRVRGKNQSDMIAAPAAIEDTTPKLVWKKDANIEYVVAAKKTGGYLMAGFVHGVTTTNNSLASTTSELTRKRLAEVLNAVWAGVYKHTEHAVSGTWTSTTTGSGAFANIVPSYTSGRAIKLRRTTQNGDYIEYKARPVNGRIVLALYSGTTASESATVEIDGDTVATIVPRAAQANTLQVFSIPVPGVDSSKECTLRLTHTGTNGTGISVVGVNFCELKDWAGEEVDSFAYFRNSSFADYLTQSSANDCVIKEYGSGTYGISYHGGEVDVTSSWLVDRAEVSLSDDGFAVGRHVELKTSAAVSWESVGGGHIQIDASWRFAAGSISHIAQLTGNVIASEMYTHMFGCNEAFTEIVYPSRVDLSGLASGTRVPLGRTNRVTLRNPTTGQQIVNEMTLYNREQNQYGGAHVWKVAGSYHKLYYGPCLGGKMAITDMAMVSTHTFE